MLASLTRSTNSAYGAPEYLMCRRGPEPIMASPHDPISVVADGDVVFMLADEVTVRVSSVVLSYASPTFATMLGDKFEEGQDERSTSHPKRINLPDDDPEAMVSLCEMIHFRANHSDLLNGRPSPELSVRLLNLAILIDKYDCIDSLCLANDAILERFVHCGPEAYASVEYTANLTAAAYLLRKQLYFALFTRRLVLDHCSPYSELLEYPCGEIIPTVALCKLFPATDRVAQLISAQWLSRNRERPFVKPYQSDL